MNISERFTYKDRKTSQISFPLGGIGSGCIGLAGNGVLVDWEIYNRPNKGSFNTYSHFAIKAEQDGKVLDARIVNGDLQGPYTGQYSLPEYTSFGFGAPRLTMAGLPHFRHSKFQGTFPIATLTLEEEKFPGVVKLTAFNPFIPLNDKDSSIPAAFFEIEVHNPTDAPIDYSFAGTLGNPHMVSNKQSVELSDELCSLHMSGVGVGKDAEFTGDVTIASDRDGASYQQFWYKGPWNDDLEVFWRDFTALGPLKDRTYPEDKVGLWNHGTISRKVTVAPGETGKARFVISWSFPTCHNYWAWSEGDQADAARAGVGPTWKNYYATIWDNSGASAKYCMEHWERLWAQTLQFRDALFASDLPPAALDAISANISILKSPTVLRLEDGTFYGWEGCHPTSGCCEGSCTHVWNYAQALPFLFPKLERSMREADYKFNLMPTGAMPFRLRLPLGVLQEPSKSFRPCADGQFGGVMKTYRDWKICGDDDWLRSLWPAVKASIEFAWSPGNTDKWDPEKSGVLTGRQHHTLDMELFGPNAWLTGFYLGALKAGAEMADVAGEPETATEYREIFERGKPWMNEHLFNGEYFFQMLDITDKSVVDGFNATDYWSEEHGEIKYQIGDGCGIDQVLAQWHSDLYGLGEIFDPAKTRTALEALYRHNFKNPMRDVPNVWRLYCLNDEAGLIMVDWPKGTKRVAITVPYAPETMHGMEYSAAITMIQHGMVDEGMTVVEAVRERYDGEKRNPWNEIECGSNYARSMSSYALLNVFSGFSFDIPNKRIGFKPIQTDANGNFRCLWSLDPAWGEYVQTATGVELIVHGGELTLSELGLTFAAGSVSLRGEGVGFASGGASVTFASPVTVTAEGPLLIQI